MFWQSDIGEITGKAQDAFAKTTTSVPNNTLALAKIVNFTNDEFQDSKFLNLEWELIDGDFKGSKISQKLKVFDAEAKKKHRALNMLKLIYQLFNITPTHSNAPSDSDLAIFKLKTAGIKIQETEPNENDRTYNWVSEVHTASGFKSETGAKLVVTHKPQNDNLESAFSRNPRPEPNLVDDIPF